MVKEEFLEAEKSLSKLIDEEFVLRHARWLFASCKAVIDGGRIEKLKIFISD